MECTVDRENLVSNDNNSIWNHRFLGTSRLYKGYYIMINNEATPEVAWPKCLLGRICTNYPKRSMDQ